MVLIVMVIIVMIVFQCLAQHITISPAEPFN